MTNLIQNGSFEEISATAARNGDWWGSTVLPGWTLEGTPRNGTNWFETVSSGHRGVLAVAGNRYLDTDATNNNIAFYQKVSGVVAEQTYRVTVTLASSGQGNGVDVFWGGEKLGNAEASGPTMGTVTFLVTGHDDAALNVLRFAGTGPSDSVGAYIDQVWMEQVGEVAQTATGEDFAIAAIHNGTSGVDTYHVDADPGRQFFVDFDSSRDVINISRDVAASWADLQKKSTYYQSEGSTVFEFYNGDDVLVFTQTDALALSHRNFVFEAAPGVDAATFGGNLIKNGSFENLSGMVRTSWGYGSTAIDGWSIGGSAKTGTNWFELHASSVRGVASTDGRYWLDTGASPGDITFSQNVQGVEAGRYYTLKIDAAVSNGAGDSVRVMWDGVQVGAIAPNSATMRTFAFVVEGHAGPDMNRLTLVGAGNSDSIGVSLDNIRLNAHLVDEPQGDVFNFGLGDGRVYVTNFEIGLDKIVVRSDFASSFEDLLSQGVVYQDGRATIIEFNNGVDSIALPQFEMERLTAEMFEFSAPIRSAEMISERKLLSGTDEKDTLIAGAGDQVFDGGAGFDVLTGGLGSDVFLYNKKSGHDFITDFDGSADRIMIAKDFIAGFDELMRTAAIYQDGNSTQIEMGEGQMITLFGVNAETVKADWFLFS
jgi:Ca2+-binding RTX toxin-like protein